MSNYNARVPADQQYKLIEECRSSGLTDYQWCREHGIQPGTFYNWVSRLRKKACCEIPDSSSKNAPARMSAQEVVRLEVLSKAGEPGRIIPTPPVWGNSDNPPKIAAMIEISLGNATIRIANGTEPAMLDRILSFMKGAVC